MAAVERVAGSGRVLVLTWVARMETVIAGIVDAAKTQGRTGAIAFAGMIEDDVENDLDPGGVECFDRGLELTPRIGGAIAGIGQEKAEAVIAPIVRLAPLAQERLVDQPHQWQQFDCGNAEPVQMIGERSRAQAKVAPAISPRYCRMTASQALEMGFVQDRFRPGRARRVIAAPVEIVRPDHHRLDHRWAGITGVKTRFFAIYPKLMTVAGVDRAESFRPGFGIRVEQQLVCVEAHPTARIVGPMDAIAVKLTQRQAGKIAVPDLIGATRQGPAQGLRHAILSV